MNSMFSGGYVDTLVDTLVDTDFFPYISRLRVQKNGVSTVSTKIAVPIGEASTNHAKHENPWIRWIRWVKSPAKVDIFAYPPWRRKWIQGWIRFRGGAHETA